MHELTGKELAQSRSCLGEENSNGCSSQKTVRESCHVPANKWCLEEGRTEGTGVVGGDDRLMTGWWQDSWSCHCYLGTEDMWCSTVFTSHSECIEYPCSGNIMTFLPDTRRSFCHHVPTKKWKLGSNVITANHIRYERGSTHLRGGKAVTTLGSWILTVNRPLSPLLFKREAGCGL